ncbi:hypothetical protein AC623_03360 [Bacillus sp. FJAT-27231]|uniref:DUF5365 family protein n=1 Tax=Bacillus sp. FJAT-27231 TaxID=1679168 RepID=UPI00067081D6|nr:DUF5365 family protein [Bacillus sp. FJAT-27231]KMY53137.1 hypothetical protein AC623_03360 [Bacillus sp. FJAT-27231]
MRVIIASTTEQEEIINELVRQLKEEILPLFFEKEELQAMYKLGILQLTDDHFQLFGTLQDAFQVISSLQTIISILETGEPASLPLHYKEIFEKNTAILQKFDIRLPFFLSHFHNKKSMVLDLSCATPANIYLI